ncbi:MAG TPA: hypothetical protein VNA19_06515 [Pyrinomonadaceae bacterium]|jgi:hypothetical protein|nr:hypothetical protein [Pyrinomonadaceae bacterium]
MKESLVSARDLAASRMSNPDWTTSENLVVVAGHAVYTADDFADPLDDDSWSLQPFQKGEPRFYLEHIRRGVELADDDARSLLVFSGGQTRVAAGPHSEAQGYWQLANHFRWWDTGAGARATTEEFARDSLENLLFAICRFYECTQAFPTSVTLVSWAFKRERFELHRAALRFPSARFVFSGVNNPADPAAALAAERTHALEPFRRDPYAAHAPLAAKREARNPFRRVHPYLSSCPPLARLLQHRGPQLFEGELPWETAGD